MGQNAALPYTIVFGKINEEIYNISQITRSSFYLKSFKEINYKLISIKIVIFNFTTYSYQHFVFSNCKLLSVVKKQNLYKYKLHYSNKKDRKNFIDLLKNLKYNIKKFWNGADAIHFKPISNEQRKLIRCIKSTNPEFDIQKEFGFSSNFSNQLNDWYNFNITVSEKNKIRLLVENIELAFALDTYQLFNMCINNSFKNLIDNQVKKYKLQDHSLFSKPFKRIYIGNYYCLSLFPNKELLLKLLDKCKREGYDITIVLPNIIDRDFDKIISLCNEIQNWTEKNEMKIELAINDWGLLYYLSKQLKDFKYLNLVLGRLLNKHKKDVRYKWKFGFDNKKSRIGENNLNSPHYLNYLNCMNIRRIEFESHVFINKIPAGNHSLHFPFYQLSGSQYCWICARVRKSQLKLSVNCQKHCMNYALLYPRIFNVIGIGNTFMGFNDSLFKSSDLLQNYIDQGIDRLVYNQIN